MNEIIEKSINKLQSTHKIDLYNNLTHRMITLYIDDIQNELKIITYPKVNFEYDHNDDIIKYEIDENIEFIKQSGFIINDIVTKLYGANYIYYSDIAKINVKNPLIKYKK
jgi:hypothetical protein